VTTMNHEEHKEQVVYVLQLQLDRAQLQLQYVLQLQLENKNLQVKLAAAEKELAEVLEEVNGLRVCKLSCQYGSSYRFGEY